MAHAHGLDDVGRDGRRDDPELDFGELEDGPFGRDDHVADGADADAAAEDGSGDEAARGGGVWRGGAADRVLGDAGGAHAMTGTGHSLTYFKRLANSCAPLLLSSARPSSIIFWAA